MSRKIITLFLFLCVVSCCVTSFGLENTIKVFNDVKGDAWYYDSLEYCFNNDYINGMTESTFEPDGLLSRAQAVTILGRMAGATVPLNVSKKLSDVAESSWAYNYIQWALNNGITTGTDIVNGITTFSPNSNVTREQLIIFISRYLKANGCDSIQNLVKTYIDMSIRRSDEFVSRAEISVIIANADKIIKREKNLKWQNTNDNYINIVNVNTFGMPDIEINNKCIQNISLYIKRYIPLNVINKFNNEGWEINLLSNELFDKKFDKIYSGMTEYNEKRIYMRMSVSNISEVICHEFGHFVHDCYGYDSSEIQNMYLYADDVVRADKIAYENKKITYKSDYVATNYRECFAESFMLYCTAADELKIACLPYFNFIESAIKTL